MPTAAEYLTTARNNAAARLSELDATPVAERARVSYSDQGRSMSWGEYRDSLVREIKELNLLIVQTAGPFEIVNTARG